MGRGRGGWGCAICPLNGGILEADVGRQCQVHLNTHRKHHVDDSPQSGGIKVTPLTELRGKDRAQPGGGVGHLWSVIKRHPGQRQLQFVKGTRKKVSGKSKDFSQRFSSEMEKLGGLIMKKGKIFLLPQVSS